MRFTLAIAIIIINISLLTGQRKIEFDIDVRGTFMSKTSYTSTSNITLTTYSNYNYTDSTVLRRQGSAHNTRKYNYKPSAGAELSALATIPLGSKLSIVTGLGFNYNTVTRETLNSSYEWLEYSEETVPIPTFTTLVPIGGNGCDHYTNSWSDVGPSSSDQKYHLINLMMPVAIYGHLLNGKLDAGAGIVLQTPVFTASSSESISIENEELGGETYCTWVLNERNSRPANGISNAQVGVVANMIYRFTPQLGLVVGVRQMVSNTFVDTHSEPDRAGSKAHKPLVLSAGLTFRL